MAQSVLERRRAQAGSALSRRRRRRVIPLVAAGVLALAMAWFLVALFQPFKGDGNGTVALTIPSGAGVGEIADVLAERGVVSSPFFFRARATLSGSAGDFKAGRFTLSRDMSYGAAIAALSQSPAAQTVSITVPEGRSRSEVRSLIGKDLEGNYLSLTERSPLLDPADYGARNASSLEGFLFPATYELKRGRGTRELVKQQVEAFKREFAKVDMSFAKTKNLSRYDVLVIASMVEREAQVADERPDHRVGDLQPAARGDPAGHRRHHPVRHRQLDAAAEGIRAGHRLALQHARRARDCRRARSAAPAWRRYRQPRGQRGRGSSSTWSSPAPAESTRSRRPTPSSSATSTRYNRARDAPRRQVSHRLLMTRTLLGVAGCPVAHSRSPAMHNAALAELRARLGST